MNSVGQLNGKCEHTLVTDLKQTPCHDLQPFDLYTVYTNIFSMYYR